jgi:hypothetical protein
MRKRTQDGDRSGIPRQSSGGFALLTALLAQGALAAPPAPPVREAAATVAATHGSVGPGLAALELTDPDTATLKADLVQSESRTPGESASEQPQRPFASGDVWLPPSALAREYPATFSTLPDMHSRAYLMDLSLPTMGGDGHGIRDQSPTEQFIRQVKKEGMPFARLWQNDQALVSLGLNRKGKPGLWIIQKTR